MLANRLFTKFVFRNRPDFTLLNRAALAPMTNSQSIDDGTLGNDEYRFLARRTKEGFGIITTCASHVAKDGQGWKGELGIFDDAHLPGLTRLAQGIHNEGKNSLAFVQIFHGGARSPPQVSGCVPFSASAHVFKDASLKSEWNVREATKLDIERVTQQFVDAAVRASRAGFDGVELHGAHGYLLHQFLSKKTNTRTDEWGGSFDNRAKLVRTVMRRVKDSVPSSFIVGVRISPEDKLNFEGIDFDESVQLARQLSEEDGADFIHGMHSRSQTSTQTIRSRSLRTSRRCWTHPRHPSL